MEYSAKVQNRLRRVEGQVRGVLGMMEKGKGGKEVVEQLAAVRAAVDRVILRIVGDTLEQAIRAGIETGDMTEKPVKDALDLLAKSR